MFIPFELQNYFVCSQKSPYFREKLDLQTCADHLDSMRVGGCMLSEETGLVTHGHILRI